MKTVAGVLAACSFCLGVYLLAAPPDARDHELQLRNLKRYARITDQPHEMQDSTITFCRAPEEFALNPHEPAFPETAFCHVYVNATAKETMLSGEGVYPEGSIVIKSKLATAGSKTPELFTVMQKMAKDYDSEHGDWKYTVVNGQTYRQVAAGRIDSCIECHVQYKDTDYITREYIADQKQTK